MTWPVSRLEADCHPETVECGGCDGSGEDEIGNSCPSCGGKGFVVEVVYWDE